MSIHTKNEIERVDASVFSGDFLLDADNRVLFKYYLARWLKELESYNDPALGEKEQVE